MTAITYSSIAPGKTPTVLQVLPALEAGGVERGTIDVAMAIKAEGWRPLVASQGGRMVRELDRAGIEHILLPLKVKTTWGIKANRGALRRVIRDYGVDLLHARSRAPAWSALAATHAEEIPFVTTFHGTYGLGPFGIKKRYNAVMTRGDRVIAISQFIAGHIATHYPAVDPAIVRVIPRGVDLNAFDPTKVSPERMIQLASRWRIPDGVPILMLPGRLTRWKGHLLLLEALALLPPEMRFFLLIVGDDQGRNRYRDEIIATATRLGLQESVRLVGNCTDMPAAYQLADVVISASTDPEAFGRVPAEAMAMGRLVIVPDHGGGPEIVQHEVTGWHFVNRHRQSLADALKAALTLSPEARASITARAMDDVHRRFSKAQMTASTLAVYGELLGISA